MESEKVKEIKKALECCSVSCTDCPYDKGETTNPICINNLTKNALTLINELESENKRLKKGNRDRKRLRRRLVEAKCRIAELEKENVCEHCQRVILGKEVYCLDCLNKFMEISLKSFAERLKEKLKARHEVDRLLPMPVRDVVLSTIEGLLEDVDKTLKEIINE